MESVITPVTHDLTAQVLEVVRRRWETPTPAVRGFAVPKGEADALARQTLDAMLTRPFRISKLPAEEEYAQLLTKVRHWVQRGRPVRIKLGYAPMKNLHTAPHCRADWAEFFALCHLCTWHNKVATVYPPGLQITIVFDDSTVRMANRSDTALMAQYMRSVGQLIAALKYQPFIVGTMRQSSFAWLFHFGLYQLAGYRMRQWEKKAVNQPILEQMLTFARRNLILPPGLSPEEQEKRYQEASHRYRVYWDALHLSGLLKWGKSLIGMYLDGTQHHVRQAAALHLATLGKEQVTQPWQGEGVLSDNGKHKLVPMVLTAGRRQRMEIQEVAGLDVIPLPGFDRIKVCKERK